MAFLLATKSRGFQAVAPLAWSAYFAIPVAGWSWLDGLPLGLLEAGAIALVWWTWAGTRALPGARTLAALTVAKFALSALLVTPGFAARYYANDTWTPPVEQSIELRSHEITRRDERLAFGSPGQPDLPLFFFNDLRFNYYEADDPDRRQLAYSAVWEGFLRHSGAPQETTFYLAAPQAAAGELAIDARSVLTLDRAATATGSVLLQPGSHSITIRVAAPYGSGRQVEAGRVAGGVRQPFSSRHVLMQPVGTVWMVIDAAVLWIARAVDLFVLSWLGLLIIRRAVAAWRWTQVAQLLWLGAIAEALLFALPSAGRLAPLTGGNDWLLYQHLARAIAFGDPLLLEPGLAGGQGAPFYFQPAYPYFVALTQLVSGDGIFGIVLVQRLLLAATVGWLASITTRLFGARAGWVALLAGGLFMYEKGGRWTAVLLAEPLFLPLVVGWIWLLVRIATEPPSTWRLLLAGITGGVATLVRSTLLLGWVIALPAWAASLRKRRLRTATVLVAIMIAVVGTATLRNWVVSRTFVPVATSFGINLYIGNTPPRELAPTPAERAAVYERLEVAQPTQSVIEYAIQAPSAFLDNLGDKALYSIGFFERSGIRGNGGERGTSWLYVGIWCAALAGAIRLLRSSTPYGMAVASLPGLAALCHFSAVVMIFPHVYGDRLILPIYPLLIPYAAFALEPVAVWAWRYVWQVTPFLLMTLALSVLLPDFPRSSTLVALLVAGAAVLAVAAGPQPLGRASWLYLGYAAGVVLTFARESLNAEDVRFELLLPVAAFAVARLVREEGTRYLVVGALLIGALISVVGAEMTFTESASAALPRRLLHVVVAASVALAALARGRPSVARSAALLAGGCTALALLLATLVEAEPSGAGVDLREPSVSVLTRELGILGALCLLGLWVRALVRTAREAWFGSSRSLAACHGALVATLLMSMVAVWPQTWQPGSSGYPPVVLGILLGLAEVSGRKVSTRSPDMSSAGRAGAVSVLPD